MMSPVLAGQFAGSQIPRALGARAWIDWTDLTTTFQDTSMLVPARAQGDLIKTVRDKSGGGYNAVQSSTGSAFSLQLGGQNGKAFGRSDGIDDYMRITNMGDQPQPNTLVFIGRWVVPGNAGLGTGTWCHSVTAGKTQRIANASFTALWSFASNTNAPSAVAADALFHWGYGVFKSPNSILSVRGTNILTGQTTNTQVLGGVTFAATNVPAGFTAVDYYEWFDLPYDLSLYSDRIALIAAYVAAKYAI